MATSVRKFVTATAASAVFAGGLLGISATPASAGEDCDDVYKRKYTEISSQWHKVVASGVIDNRRSDAAVRQSIAAGSSAGLKGGVEGEIGGKLDLAAAEQLNRRPSAGTEGAPARSAREPRGSLPASSGGPSRIRRQPSPPTRTSSWGASGDRQAHVGRLTSVVGHR
ncbi:hypothetical protein ACIP46_17170 [Streptomyces lavendulae]|uniref:hypothetical protein n=1 Tax=Streptomyces lavendulae TaxID=1914 RepID=UPI00382E19B3